MFLEQVFNPIENRPTLSKEEIDASFDNFYGKGERPLTLPDDMSGQYNTQLTPEQETAYQAWAKQQGRERDVENYDLRGAWLELQNGTMSEDERGHLGDKYKKPNHPTFSTESIYNGKDGYQGGVWSRNGNVDVYTPQHKLTPEQAKRLKLYFAQNEEGVALNLKDKVYDNPTIQLAPKSVGAFDGLAKGILYPIPNALVRMFSGALMVASKAMPWVRDDFLKQMEQASEDLDNWNRMNLGANPETMGKASQIIHGLEGMIAELAIGTKGAGLLAAKGFQGVGAAEKIRKASIVGGSTLFGTDIGISERNRLVSEGVDKDTAFWAGLGSGITNTIGAAIPPFLGSSRTWSALYGAGSNVALNYAELSTISYVLDHQDYTELAKQYELNMVDMLVSAGVGAFMGTVFWRNPVDVKYDRAHQRVYERYKSDLEAGGKFSQEEIESQAKLNAAAAVSYARMAHIAPDQVDDMAAKLIWTDDRKAFAVPDEYFSQEAQERLNLLNRSRQLDEQIHKWREGDTTEKFDLGSPSWVLQLFGAKKDSNVKIFGKSFLHAILKPGETLRRQRGKHGLTDEEVRGLLVGIQRPIAVFRSKNIDAKSGEESIVLLTELTQNGKSVVAPLWLTSYKNGTIVVDNQVPTAFAKSNIKQWIDEGLLLGYEKEKGLSLLLESMGSNRQQLGTSNRDKPLINGAIIYQNDTSLGDLYQIIGEHGVSVMDQADENWSRTNNRNVALQMEYSGKTPKEIRLATGWERGADGKWRYEIPDIKIREDGFRMLRDREKAIRDQKDDWAYSDEGINASIEEVKSHEAAIDSAHESDVLTTTLDKLVDAPDLFKAYPQLRKMTVEFGKLPKGTGGYLSLGTMTMRLGLDAGVFANSTRSTLIHEIQHAVQEIEGFARGADPKRMPGKGDALFIDMQRLRELRGSSDWREYQEAADEMLRQSEAETTDDAAWKRATSRFDAAEKLPGVQEVRAEEKRLTDKWGDSPDVLQAINNAADITDPVFARITESDPYYRYQSYARVAGEVEARNVQTRKDMTPEERAEISLRDTEGVPRNEQIITSREWLELYQLGYHGTPYLFDAFTLAHIGSGEGAQAHGWGLYFALNRRTAEDYARRLSSWIDDVQLLKLSRSLKKDREAASFFKRHLYKEREDALTTFWMNRYSLQAVDEAFKEGSITKQAYEWFNAEVRTKAKGAREMHLYTVDIPNDDVMLREEWKISNQNDAVKEAYRQYCKERFGLDSSDISTDYVNGYDFYRDLTKWQGGPKEASLWLNKHGVKGIRYNGHVDGECAVVWDEKSIKILEYLQKGQEGIRGAFNPSTNTIRLTPNANLSTFSHEHAHWYLTNTLALGGKEGAPLELQSQINAILHAFGLKSINDWNALGFEGQRKYQEQFAAWTEIYLTQGKSPVKGLEGVFAKMAEWLIGMYKAALGKDAGPDAAVREVSDRYQAQFGEKLPELSPEVRKVLDMMYGAQQKRSAFKSSKAQAMAGRLVQAQRVNQTKVSAPISDPHGPTAGNVGQAAQGKAVSDLNNGRKVDVSEQVGDTEANVPVVEDTQSTFARGVSIGDGDNSRVVVLQNRNRSDPNSVAQMNSIATDPQYGRLSTSRTTQSGAPIVSFGHLPDKAYQGKSEIITESNGNKVPVTYYVVEADDVMRSNNYDGTPNKEWNNDNPDQMRAIAGNGRMAGLSEAYNRGTAEQYRQDLMADSDNHGVSPETIKGMKKPVLVRYMPPDRVTTGFVERSNTSDVLVRSSLETAVQDSPKVRKNIGKYEFDEDGDPTKETLGQFLTDVGEVSEMGNLIDSNGNPTTAARARIKAAVFYEAYRDKRLTELVADSEDKHGIKRILSAMSAFAPHVIQIRETSGGAIDLAPIITDATHRILQARINGEGVDFTAQGDMFSSNPATEMVTNFLSQNRNSAAAMLRVLRPFAEQVENALQAADSPMFADLAVKTDLADAMALFRKAENQEIRNRSGDLLGDADGKLLPEIDVEAMRSSLANTLKDGKNLVNAISDGVAETNRKATPEAKAEAQQQHLIEQQNAREVLSENSEAVRARNFALEDPNRELVMTDEAGNDIVISAKDAMAQADEIEKGLNDDTAGLGMGVACIIRNQGIR